jgi:hypothetical protein
MKTEEINDPLIHDPFVLLTGIETDPHSFQMGNRNDDLVNWFIAKKIYELKQTPPVEFRPVSAYISDFDGLELSVDAVHDLRNWGGMSPAIKIGMLHRYYGKVIDMQQLRNLWIPMAYPMPLLPPPML